MIRRLRLASGLVMFAYVTTHFVNHSLGLVSVQVMDRALEHIYHYWASLLGSVLLYGAFATHYSLALWALWLRRSLKMPFAEATQLVLGFSIPFFLTDHVLQTRVADTFYGADVGYYSTMLHTYFVSNPLRGDLVHGRLRCRHTRQRGAHQRVNEELPDAGDCARAQNRIRARRGYREGRACQWDDAARRGDPSGLCLAGRI
jgi:hypothetical protein